MSRDDETSIINCLLRTRYTNVFSYCESERMKVKTIINSYLSASADFSLQKTFCKRKVLKLGSPSWTHLELFSSNLAPR